MKTNKKIKDFAQKFTSENKGTFIGARRPFGWYAGNNTSLDPNPDTTGPTSYYTHSTKDISNNMPGASQR